MGLDVLVIGSAALILQLLPQLQMQGRTCQGWAHHLHEDIGVRGLSDVPALRLLTARKGES